MISSQLNGTTESQILLRAQQTLPILSTIGHSSPALIVITSMESVPCKMENFWRTALITLSTCICVH